MEDKNINVLKGTNFTVAFSVFFILGIVAYLTQNIGLVAFILLIGVVWLLCKNKITSKSAIILYSIFALSVLLCFFRVKTFDDLSRFIPANATLKGVVVTIPTTNIDNKTKFYLKVDTIVVDGAVYENLNAKTIVTLYDDRSKYSAIKIADIVELKGFLRNPLQSKNPGQFDYSKYLKFHNTFSTFYVNPADWKIISSPTGFKGQFLQKLSDKRQEIIKREQKYIGPDKLEVLGGIVFGDDAINPPDYIKASFINSGLLHILAASGMNVSIIFGIWYFIGIRLRLNYRINVFIGAMLVVLYTLMTGMGPSVLRAALMIEFVLLGKLIDRDADSIALVFFVAFLMLLYNPLMLCDVGFQLSFVVTFALMYCCPPVLENIKSKFVEFCAGAILIPFVAQLWASPIQMFYFNTYATYSVLANFVIVPFVMIISFLGFVLSILSALPFDLFVDKVCFVFSIILNPVVGCLIRISGFFSSLPNSLLTTIHPNIFQVFIYYTLLLALVFICRNKLNSRKNLILCIILLFCLLFSFVKIPQHRCEILVFDVGNADSFLIKTPANKYIMIDTAHGLVSGSRSSFSQADAIMNKYFKDNGIKKLELLLLTHFDADHSGGAIDVLKQVKTENIIISKDKDNSKTTSLLMNYFDENKLCVNVALHNKIVYSEKHFVLKTYTPDFVYDRSDNDNSTVALLSYGDFDMLFMADGSIRSFEKIKRDLHKHNIEILKSGHHGARNTVSKSMLTYINPDSVIISTGLNSYGHPHKETLATIEDSNSKIYRTDLDNAIKIIASKKEYKLLKYNTQKRRFVEDYKHQTR